MSWGWAESLAFYAVMTIQNRKFEKEQRLIKTQNFYQKCYEKIAEEISGAADLTEEISNKASSVYIPNEISGGMAFLPLFCFGKVIQRQGKVTKEQNYVMGVYFNHVDYGFTPDRFTSAMIRGQNISNFNELMEMTPTRAGKYWVNLFRAFYKVGTQKDFQAIVDSVTATIMRFSVLGDLNNNIAVGICDDFVKAANQQIQHVMELPVNDVDWLGILPIADHKMKIQELYYAFLRDTDITEDADEDDLKDLLNAMYMHTVCDIVMLTKKPNSVKLKMIEDGLQLVGVTPIIAPADYVREVANHEGIGGNYRKFFSCEEGCGMFWKMIVTLGGKTGREKDVTQIYCGVFSVLIQVEDFLVKKYQFLGIDQIVKKYSLGILKLASDYIDSVSEG